MDLVRRIRDKLRQSNGWDQLAQLTAIVSFAFLTVSICIENQMLFLGAVLVVIYTFYRVLSTEKDLRGKENQQFLIWIDKLEFKLRCRKIKIEMRKSYKYFRCYNCKKKLRVPKGKGKIEVKCPICGNRFIKKT